MSDSIRKGRRSTPEGYAKWKAWHDNYIKRPDVIERIRLRDRIRSKSEARKELERKRGKKRRSDPVYMAKQKKYRHENRVALRLKKMARLNTPERIEMHKAWVRKSRNRPICRIRNALSQRVKSALTRPGVRKNNPVFELLGCDKSTLMAHLQSLFKEGMTWENYGFRGWHIDHIRPCSSFDLSLREEQLKCFNYTNLQPLWWRDNIIKAAKYDPVLMT